MKNAAMPTIDTGMPRMIHAQRQPSGPPAQTAIAPTSTGLARPRPWPIMLLSADIRARTPIG